MLYSVHKFKHFPSEKNISSMAIRLIQRRYSTFIVNAFTHCRNSSTIGAPIQLQKRFYFNNREEYDDDQRYWFHNPKRVRFTLFFFTSSGKSVTVPYTERSHFILFHKFFPKILPDEPVTHEIQSVLPPLHPDSLTARRIFQDIIHQASHIQNRKEQDEEEEKGIESEKFQIIVIDSPTIVAAASGGSRKIYVTSGMLRREAMIATFFGHEVGHDLAFHNQELLSKLISLVSGIGMSLFLFCKSAYVRSKMPYLDMFMRLRFIPSFCFVVAVPLLSYLPMLMYSRKIEVEADYIGLMLASSAGYDPLVGAVFPNFVAKKRKRTLPKCFYPVPSGEERIEILAHPRIINEAVSRHRKGTDPRQGTQPPVED